MSSDCNNITHKGVVENINNNTVFVKIIVSSACASCKVKSYCAITEMKEMLVEVNVKNPFIYEKGQNVTLSMRNSLGGTALFLAYVLPFIIMFSSLILLTSLGYNELFSGLFAIIILIPYFFLLYLIRKKLKKKFIFSLNSETYSM